MEIYERLFITMYDKGIMQRDIFENIEGTTKSTVSAWKTRKSDPPAKLLIPLCQLLGVSVEYMLTGEVSKTSTVCFPKNNIDEADMQLLEQLKQLSTEDKAEVRGVIRGMLMKASKAGAKTEAV